MEPSMKVRRRTGKWAEYTKRCRHDAHRYHRRLDRLALATKAK
jgi:hypothetical protein